VGCEPGTVGRQHPSPPPAPRGGRPAGTSTRTCGGTAPVTSTEAPPPTSPTTSPGKCRRPGLLLGVSPSSTVPRCFLGGGDRRIPPGTAIPSDPRATPRIPTEKIRSRGGLRGTNALQWPATTAAVLRGNTCAQSPPRARPRASGWRRAGVQMCGWRPSAHGHPQDPRPPPPILRVVRGPVGTDGHPPHGITRRYSRCVYTYIANDRHPHSLVRRLSRLSFDPPPGSTTSVGLQVTD